MRDIYIGIFHKDHQYGKRLMKYLNHQKEFPMTAWFTSDEKTFFDQEKKRKFQCLVLEEGMEYRGNAPVCRIGQKGEDKKAGSYQSGRVIAEEIYDCLKVKRGGEQTLVAVYSPLTRYQVSQFAQRFAGEHGFIYFGMQPYGHFRGKQDEEELLLFYMKQHKEGVISYFLSHQQSMDVCRGYPAVGCYLDFRELSLEDYRWFFQKLKKEQISVLFDIGAACPPDLLFFQLFDKVYLPLMRGDLKSFEYLQFKEQMQHHEIWYQTVWEEVMITTETLGKEQEEWKKNL